MLCLNINTNFLTLQIRVFLLICCHVNAFHSQFEYVYGQCPLPQGPLCGDDGISYNNVCLLMEAKTGNPTLKVLHHGACGTELVIEDNSLKLSKRRDSTRNKKMRSKFKDYTL